jgi:hypothetical protein
MNQVLAQHTLPAGYFPQLPDTVTGTDASGADVCVGGTTGYGIEGYDLHVFYPHCGRERTRYVVRTMLFPTHDASKAFCLAKGYLVPWRYGTTALHPMARGYAS